MLWLKQAKIHSCNNNKEWRIGDTMQIDAMASDRVYGVCSTCYVS